MQRSWIRPSIVLLAVVGVLALPAAGVSQPAEKTPTAQGTGGAAATVDLLATHAAIEALRDPDRRFVRRGTNAWWGWGVSLYLLGFMLATQVQQIAGRRLEPRRVGIDHPRDMDHRVGALDQRRECRRIVERPRDPRHSVARRLGPTDQRADRMARLQRLIEQMRADEPCRSGDR